MIEIDGSKGAGGGQIVRTALALSTILGKPFHMINIRQGRADKHTGKKGGLKPQHLMCVKALEKLCGAKATGVELGSSELTFNPGKIKPGTISLDIGTAGSITLLMQALLLPSILSGGRVRFKIKGGTDVSWSMPMDYFSEILLPQLHKFADIKFKLVRRGYYPKGGGEIELIVKGKFDLPADAPKFDLIEPGKLIQIKGVAHSSDKLAEAEVAEREMHAAKQKLSSLGAPIDIRTEYQDTLSVGTGITLWAIKSKDEDEIDFVNPIRLGGDCLGERGKKAEVVGEEASAGLMEQLESGGAVDKYLADNLIPFLGMFGGSMKVASITEHTRTNIYIVEQFIDKKFEIDEDNKVISVK